MNTWGKNFRISIFGESHGEAIGLVIDGLKSGIKIDFENINFELARRSPNSHNNLYSTARKENDEYQILSGVFNGYTSGSPLSIIFLNKDKKSIDYDEKKYVLRPGHADYTAFKKYNFFNDYRGGGHFSGRLTLALVFAGAIAKQILTEKNIKIYSHIKKVLDIEDEKFLNNEQNIKENVLENLKNEKLPFINKNLKYKLISELNDISKNGDSISGIVECMIINLETGIGEPFFDSIESKISSIIFSIPAIKGIEFGLGFDFSKTYGSIANDTYSYDEKTKIKINTNNNGGILGGISNSAPIIFSTVVKPTPSISKKQKTINIKTLENVELEIKGRHDAFIVPRVIPVIESAAAIAILDLLLEK